MVVAWRWVRDERRLCVVWDIEEKARRMSCEVVERDVLGVRCGRGGMLGMWRFVEGSVKGRCCGCCGWMNWIA